MCDEYKKNYNRFQSNTVTIKQSNSNDKIL